MIDKEHMKILAIGFKGVSYFENDVKSEAESRGHSMDFANASSLTVDLSNDHVDIRAAGMDMTQYDVIHVGSLAKNRWPLTATFSFLKRVHGTVIVDDRIVSSTLGEYSGLYKYFVENEEGILFHRSIVFRIVKEVKGRLEEFNITVIIKKNNIKQGGGFGLAHDL